MSPDSLPLLDFGAGLVLRQATGADHDALCDICLKTGDAGQDATAREDDPMLLGLVYAVPYQLFEPELAFVVEGASGICGYLLGARDTAEFNQRLNAEWYPQLRQSVRDPGALSAGWQGSDHVRDMIHRPQTEATVALRRAYPSHGHIDLLPSIQGRGVGTRAMQFLMQRLAACGSPGMHLEVHPRNLPAQNLYRKLGFAESALTGTSSSLHMVRRLP